MSGGRSNPINADRRRARKRVALAPDAACTRCGIAIPEVLEAHHVSGDAGDPSLTTWFCANCHKVLTAHQHDAGVDLRHDELRSVLGRAAAASHNQAVLFHDLVESRERDARRLTALEAALDRAHPDWRKLPEAEPWT